MVRGGPEDELAVRLGVEFDRLVGFVERHELACRDALGHRKAARCQRDPGDVVAGGRS